MLLVEKIIPSHTRTLRQASDGKLGRGIPEQIAEGFYGNYTLAERFIEHPSMHALRLGVGAWTRGRHGGCLTLLAGQGTCACQCEYGCHAHVEYRLSSRTRTYVVKAYVPMIRPPRFCKIICSAACL